MTPMQILGSYEGIVYTECGFKFCHADATPMMQC